VIRYVLLMDRETVEEIKRHFGVVAEGLRTDIRAVAEGQSRLAERFDGLERRMDASLSTEYGARLVSPTGLRSG